LRITRPILLGAALVLPAAAALAQDAPADFCSELKQVAALAPSKDRFASIAGKAREGNFNDTTLPLPGWQDCSLYGTTAYTCDSEGFGSAEAAGQVQATVADTILSCFAGTWLEIKDRSSPGYVVLNPARGPASMTLSIDENEKREAIVRLTLFVRRN